MTSSIRPFQEQPICLPNPYSIEIPEGKASQSPEKRRLCKKRRRGCAQAFGKGGQRDLVVVIVASEGELSWIECNSAKARVAMEKEGHLALPPPCLTSIKIAQLKTVWRWDSLLACALCLCLRLRGGRKKQQRRPK
ncbi:hypothetical protein MGYG_03509 [Nannizzia gypsea CBS 118893]|uniref:Uncharacterized protein n=1 Tax=Arthroderma gypseum (strain ATCC MYA-4604 / CBS 118893) TaxID=535722 RepID=E4USD9_ARTGP|nr:hypothetical protein MGYG_03509 [Nannizzia gypsea CBS 118893]EFR00506.1 hypothetical protein MGYG_03509 [Nannizzia gypsea CBS 118893]